MNSVYWLVADKLKQSLSFLIIFRSTDPLLVVLFILGFFSFTTVSLHVSVDLSGYMNQALNLINGEGYIFTDGQPIYTRGPGFPLFIALSYKFFGVSVESTFYVIRLFCILNPVIIYLLGKRIFNREVGFAAALLILLSLPMSRLSYRHLDAVWPFFVILHCYFLCTGFERKNKSHFVFAGLSLTVAYLTKEVALLFLPLALLLYLWVGEYRNRESLKGVAICILTLIVTLFPWVLYLWRHDALFSLWGTGGPVVLGDMVVSNSIGGGVVERGIHWVKQYGVHFHGFYSDEGYGSTVAAQFVIAPLFLITWLFLFLRSITADKGARVLLLNLLLFLPIIYFIGKNHWRFGQVLHTMLISYLALSAMLYFLSQWIGRLIGQHMVFQRGLFYIILLIVLFFQVFSPGPKKGYSKFYKKSTISQLLSSNEKSTVSPVTGQVANVYLLEVMKYLESIAEESDIVLTNGIETARLIHFATNGTRKVAEIPRILFKCKGVWNGGDKEDVILISTYHWPAEQSRFWVFYTTKQQMEMLIEAKNVKYILLSPTLHIYNEYFSASAKYEMLFSAGPVGRRRKYRLFRIHDFSLAEDDFPIFASGRFKKAMKIMKKEKLGYYSCKEDLISRFNNLTVENFEQICLDPL